MLYSSTSDKDDLAVAASLLKMATGQDSYLNDAKSFHEAGTRWALSWDDTMVAADVSIIHCGLFSNIEFRVRIQ